MRFKTQPPTGLYATHHEMLQNCLPTLASLFPVHVDSVHAASHDACPVHAGL